MVRLDQAPAAPIVVVPIPAQQSAPRQVPEPVGAQASY